VAFLDALVKTTAAGAITESPVKVKSATGAGSEDSFFLHDSVNTSIPAIKTKGKMVVLIGCLNE
jgi:hypothetical protein